MVNLNTDFQDDFNQYYGTSYDMTAGQQRRQTSLEKLQDPKFINTLKDYYSYRDGNDFQYQDDADVLDIQVHTLRVDESCTQPGAETLNRPGTARELANSTCLKGERPC